MFIHFYDYSGFSHKQFITYTDLCLNQIIFIFVKQEPLS